MLCLIALTVIYCGWAHSYHEPMFINGRPRDGFMGAPVIEDVKLLQSNAQLKEHWFDQQLDHYDDTNSITWSQRYFVNPKYFKPSSGPVFLMVGGEGTLSSKWLTVGAMVDYAVANKALMLALEHRFYGKSRPLSDTSTESLRYLSSEQALADLASFRLAMTEKFGLSDESNKWVVFGGSYPGALSAWFRYKFPHLVHGAVATSAPVHAQLNFPQYIEVATASLGTHLCQNNVRNAVNEIEKMMKSQSGRKVLSEKFRTCDLLGENVYDQMQFASALAGNFFGVIQYNKDNRAWEGVKGANITVDTLCGLMNNEELGDVVERYAVVNNMLMKIYSTKCVDVSYQNFVKFMRETNWESGNALGARQWIYQTCTEFGYFQTTDSSKQVFGTSIPLNFYLQQCIDIYGEKFNVTSNERGIRWTNTNYGGYLLSRGASRIVFPNGSIDPWHALSFLKSVDEIVAVFIEGTAHCANMYPSSDTDSQQLRRARKLIGEIVHLWIIGR